MERRSKLGFSLVLPVIALVSLVAFPYVEFAGFLLGASVLAPIFIMGEVGKNPEEQTRYKQWPYISALMFWFSTVALLIQFIYFMTGQSLDLNFFQYPWLLTGFELFMFASFLVVVPVLTATESLWKSGTSRVIKSILGFGGLYLYSTRAYLFYYDITEHQFGLHILIIAVGFVCFLITGWGFFTGRPRLRGQIVFGVISALLLLVSLYLNPSVV